MFAFQYFLQLLIME